MAKKLQTGHELKQRELKRWMRKLLRSGVGHTLAQQGECVCMIEDYSQYLEVMFTGDPSNRLSESKRGVQEADEDVSSAP